MRLLPQGPVCLRTPDSSAPSPPGFGAGRARGFACRPATWSAFLLPAFLLPAPLVGSVSAEILERRVDTFGCHGRTCSGHLDEKCTVPSLSRSPGHKGVYARLRALCPAMTFIPSGLPRC